MSDTSRISPTAHYTSYVWYRNGLSHPALATPAGRFMYGMLAPFNAAYRRVSGRPDLQMNLLGRHHAIDNLLEQAIAEGRVGQVVEIAAGLSPRGLRFTRRHPDLIYVEGDLPGMAARKHELLTRANLLGPRHHVVALNALVPDGPQSLEAAAELLDPKRGVAVITEGLLNYFDERAVRDLWRRIAALVRRHGGVYLADLSLGEDTRGGAARAFQRLLELVVRGQLHLHFPNVDAARAAVLEAGFASAEIHDLEGPGQYFTRIVEARA